MDLIERTSSLVRVQTDLIDGLQRRVDLIERTSSLESAETDLIERTSSLERAETDLIERTSSLGSAAASLSAASFKARSSRDILPLLR